MKTATGLGLLAFGAILAFAVRASPSWVSLHPLPAETTNPRLQHSTAISAGAAGRAPVARSADKSHARCSA